MGLTANAVASVSLEPRLVLVCMDRMSDSLGTVLATRRFGLSILGAEDESLARRFSDDDPNERFMGIGLRKVGSGVSVLAGALAWLDCRVWREFEAGDHLIILGEVLECGVEGDGDPLIFFKGEYGTVAS